MASVRLYLWRVLAAFFPNYGVRSFLFRTALRNTIGHRSSLHRGLEVYCVGGVTIGKECTINKYVDLDGRGGVSIGDRVSISAYAKILSASHDPNSPSFAYLAEPVSIGDFVWIGTGALVLPGVTLGKGCVVAAGSVVTRSVAPFEIVAGNPARKIGDRAHDLAYTPYWRPPFQ
jgi:acetyltransferase-like isoleucine patch superfamily enzyme